MGATNKRCKFDWNADVRSKEQRQSGVQEVPPEFDGEPATLAWLQKFLKKRTARADSIQQAVPWLWTYDWDLSIDLDDAGVKQLKQAVRYAEAMESSLSAFLTCVKDRLRRLRRTLKDIAPKSYFPLLSDDVLALIFEFASMPYSQATGDEYENKTPSNIAQVSRRFRAVALGLPRIWRYIGINSDVGLIASRSAVAGPILEALVGSTRECRCDEDDEQRCTEIFSFMGRISTISDRITVLRFDLSPEFDEGFFEKMRDAKKLAYLDFPSLNELVLNYENLDMEFRSIHFYRNWSTPSLKVLKIRNVIPEILSSVYGRLTEFSITLDRQRSDTWKFPRIVKLLAPLSSVRTLEIILHGRVMTKSFSCKETATLPKVEYLKTAFPDMLVRTAGEFCAALTMQNLSRWHIEIEPDEKNERLSEWGFGSFFCFPRFFAAGKLDETFAPSHKRFANLKEVDLVIYGDFLRGDCDGLRSVLMIPQTLERLTVTYNAVTEQLRRFELLDCKGKLQTMVKDLDKGFDEELGVGNPHLVLEGSEVELDSPEDLPWML
ncbi:hypothetical protein SCHPADRAFT_652343 [Schizopora paradoxa]|uniref:F-box domain-containing protein n=1 Tax=Schizopora paradoxa TaxID=27342 RepID=A0A0H2RCX6_9AGAM|nr:hypothetical protein SCHPADRAFT_652343 [Schizopora paradoxa]